MKKRRTQEKLLSSSQSASSFSSVLSMLQLWLENPVALFSSLILSSIAVITYFWTGHDDFDLWWHLRYGEHFVSNHTWTIDQAAYSWTPTVIKWKYCTWLGSSLLYLIFNSFSIQGLIILKWLIFCAVFTLCILFIKLTGDKLDITHVAAFLLMAVVFKLNGDYLKPERFSDILFTLTVFIYACAKVRGIRLFYLYPFMFLFWVNTHGGFLNGMVFITVALVGETVNTFVVKKGNPLSKHTILYFGATVLLSYAVTLINPSGIEYHLSLLKEYTTPGSAAQVATTRLYAWISMWNYLFPSHDRNSYTISIYGAWCMMIMFTVFCLVAILTFRKKGSIDITMLLLNILFFCLSMKLGRATLYYPLVWFFTILAMLKNNELLHIKRKYLPVALLLCLFWSFLLLFQYITMSRWAAWQGSYVHDFVPEKEVQFMKQYRLPGPLFNDYSTGGYLMWAAYPEYKVFVDPRQAPYMETVLPDYFDFQDHPSQEKLNQLNAKYPFRTAIIKYNWVSLIGIFAESPYWRLVYFDKNAAVFVHISELEYLPQDARMADLSASRFRDLKNPAPFAFLFEMYIHLNPLEALELCRIFSRNVNDLFIHKQRALHSMESRLPRQQETR